MYSTLNGAKFFAKKLSRLLAENGFEIPLHVCQELAARAGGFRDWRDLQGVLTTRSVLTVQEIFRQRLVSEMPPACRAIVDDWLTGALQKAKPNEKFATYWYYYVYPYLFGSSVLHRSKSALLRSGSGAGQRLRKQLVVGLMLDNMTNARLDPRTLAFVVHGFTAEIFGEATKHPRFGEELQNLVTAGIFAVSDDKLFVFPNDAAALTNYVVEHHKGLIAYGLEAGHDANELAARKRALRFIEATQVAD